MSGGSWNYVHYKINDAAQRLYHQESPLRRALGKKMQLIAEAMHDIEWVDSGDYGKGDEIPAIKAALGEDAELLAQAELIREFERLHTKWRELIGEADAD